MENNLKLIVGTDATWSLRAWLCAEIAGLDITTRVVNLSQPNYKIEIEKYSAAGLVPVLVTDTVKLNDSLAIAEYLNEVSAGRLLPAQMDERAVARSLVCELHSGFFHLRSTFPFSLAPVDQTKDFTADVNKELARVGQIFGQAKLPFMFETAGMVDAFYAILAFRLKTYGIELAGKAGEYQHSLLKWPLLKAAIKHAESWKS